MLVSPDQDKRMEVMNKENKLKRYDDDVKSVNAKVNYDWKMLVVVLLEMGEDIT